MREEVLVAEISLALPAAGSPLASTLLAMNLT